MHNEIEMIERTVQNEVDPRIAKLREEICEKLPSGRDWLNTPHALLAGKSPEQLLTEGDYDSVHNLLHSILYIGIS